MNQMGGGTEIGGEVGVVVDCGEGRGSAVVAILAD
jgi:hypothetical protein